MKVVTGGLHYLFPASCFCCQETVESPGLCVVCWRKLPLQPCAFELPQLSGFSVAPYANPVARHLILQMKHGDQPQLADFWGSLIFQALPLALADFDSIVPIPLHWWRLFHRQYNQAGLMARALASKINRPYWRPLRRVRSTPPQGHLSVAERQHNVRQAFRVPASQQRRLRNQSILLVDDVLTSGATLEEAARVLLEQGARRVSFATATHAHGETLEREGFMKVSAGELGFT